MTTSLGIEAWRFLALVALYTGVRGRLQPVGPPLCAHFDPKSGPRHTVFGALWGFWRPICSHFRLGADFSNWLSSLENRRVIAPPLCLP